MKELTLEELTDAAEFFRSLCDRVSDLQAKEEVKGEGLVRYKSAVDIAYKASLCLKKYSQEALEKLAHSKELDPNSRYPINQSVIVGESQSNVQSLYMRVDVRESLWIHGNQASCDPRKGIQKTELKNLRRVCTAYARILPYEKMVRKHEAMLIVKEAMDMSGIE